MSSFINKIELLPSKKIFICFNESPLKLMKNDIYFMLKALFVHIYILLFGYIEKRLDKQAEVNFKIRDYSDWTTSNYNTYIVQYLQK